MTDGMITIRQAAGICHAANYQLREALGEDPGLIWGDVDLHTAESAIAGVKHKLDNPDTPPEQMHEQWLVFKGNSGWVYGEEKDVELKTHPCMLPYDALPVEQRVKDVLFSSIVNSLKTIIDDTPEGFAQDT